MIQADFANNAKTILESDERILGLAVAGSWLSNQIDEFSDLDLIVVTREKISNDSNKMREYAERLGNLLSCFTGEHVGEPRLLICLYDNPLLHVDLKFVTLEEFSVRIETPTILFDREDKLQGALENSTAQFPYPDYQWIEDRFWIWIHYALLKIGRGEYLEAFDFSGFLRMVVLGPLSHIKNEKLPRGVRKVEMELNKDDFNKLKASIPAYNRQSLLISLRNSVMLYKELRSALFNDTIKLQHKTEEKVMHYFEKIESERSK